MPKVLNITNQRFGRLVVRAKTALRQNRRIIWRCNCDCGNRVKVSASDLVSGYVKSCGCLKREALPPPPQIRHGYTSRKYVPRVYRCWIDIIQRCENPNNKFYKDYGGRGIKVCKRWRNDFVAFLADVGEPPVGKSIDRYPNNNGGYKPSNVRWGYARTTKR